MTTSIKPKVDEEWRSWRGFSGVSQALEQVQATTRQVDEMLEQGTIVCLLPVTIPRRLVGGWNGWAQLMVQQHVKHQRMRPNRNAQVTELSLARKSPNIFGLTTSIVVSGSCWVVVL